MVIVSPGAYSVTVSVRPFVAWPQGPIFSSDIVDDPGKRAGGFVSSMWALALWAKDKPTRGTIARESVGMKRDMGRC
jgi:hypothetical protein